MKYKIKVLIPRIFSEQFKGQIIYLFLKEKYTPGQCIDLFGGTYEILEIEAI